MQDPEQPVPASKRRDAIFWLRSLAAWLDLAALRALARMSALGIVCGLLFATAPAQAVEETPPAAPAAKAPAEETWTARLRDALVRLDEARRQYDRANQAYSQSLHHGGQGEALRRLAVERSRRQKHLLAARAALPSLIEEARAAGVDDETLAVYEGIRR